jgi:hypothetical protein
MSKMKVKTIGIDLAKETFGLHGVDGRGRVVVHKRITRKHLVGFLVKLEPCLVGIRARGSHDAPFTEAGYTDATGIMSSRSRPLCSGAGSTYGNPGLKEND